MSEAYYEHPVSCPECGLPTNFLTNVSDPDTGQSKMYCEWCIESEQSDEGDYD
mgnify:CR=1 FL=1|jgi:hypothetical protein|tara:strand:+ start:689 stop:847 length:159 start_codon:yes stop_codon:yes gene_type:complete